MEGDGTLPNGKWIKWSAIKLSKAKQEPVASKIAVIDTSYQQKIWYPNMAYGFDTLPKQQTYVIKNVTVWTGEANAILKNAAVIIVNGKIKFVGEGGYQTPLGAKEIDGTGMFLTAGIIDEHSHIAISKGVNEGGQAIAAEVSIGDVVSNFDINIYRQLAGGVTTSQLLHGSADPIGGQSAIIKLKWGMTADQMLVPNAPKFIKFALGENVKQSNWGDFNTVRFPQTRMGVEQLYVDAFHRAIEYRKENDKGNSKRRDLELDALVEVLESNRHITCHSYIQSEINMLMHVADTFGFKVNTFTHILEGYKIADKMKAHGAGGSTFSDWWAYKYEVKDAIPYNAKLMNDQGVVVAINSDDAEMGRRLNQEAAKGVKYGGMSEQDAWKMVTLNPAKLLHLDDRIGSVKEGKDADLVLWTAHPLSIEAIADKVFIDGIKFYDRKDDATLRNDIRKEHARIISKMGAAAKGGAETKPFQKEQPKFYHCNTLEEAGTCDNNHH
jgi:imidazolonepropionase-like amidohydrolase